MTTTLSSAKVGEMDNECVLADGSVIGPTHRSYWVVEGRFAAGAYPNRPGHRDPEHPPKVMVRLLDAGVDCFVNLTEDKADGGNSDFTLSDSDLTRYDDICGTAIIDRRPIVDVSIPTVNQMIETLDSIDAHIAAGRNVYVHCWGGKGRTGTVVGCWMVRHGHVSPEDAIYKLSRLRRGDIGAGDQPSPDTNEQANFIETWILHK